MNDSNSHPARYPVDPELRVPTYQELYDFTREIWTCLAPGEGINLELFNKKANALFIHPRKPLRCG